MSGKYDPCPSCKRDFGMGLSTIHGMLRVWCDCGFHGPQVPNDPPALKNDKLAIDAWNQIQRDT